MSVLDAFQEQDASPSVLSRSLPPQPHFHEQLNKANKLKSTRSPFVQCGLLQPCFRVPRVQGRRQKGFILRVSLYHFG